jgi:predicted amidophosphoribosyltransferase
MILCKDIPSIYNKGKLNEASSPRSIGISLQSKVSKTSSLTCATCSKKIKDFEKGFWHCEKCKYEVCDSCRNEKNVFT